MTDSDRFLDEIKAGNEAAFAEWMSEVVGDVRKRLRTFSRTVDTEAVLQESLLRVWQVAPRFKSNGRKNGLLNLCKKIAVNLAINETRRARTKPVDPNDLADGAYEGTRVQHEQPDPHLRAIIKDCHGKLPARPALALMARVNSKGGRPDADLAAAVGMKTNTFLQNISRGRKLLRDCLQRQSVDLTFGEHV